MDSTAPKNTPNANLQSIGIILLSVMLGIAGQLTFKAAMNNIGALDFSIDTLFRMGTNPLLLIGLFIYAASTACWLLALMRADLSFAYPFLSLSYAGVLLGGALVFQENITLPRVIGFVVIMVGLLVVARGEQQAS